MMWRWTCARVQKPSASGRAFTFRRNLNLLYIPKGFAHGFLALEEGTLFSYLCGDRYDPESDGGVRWDDPTLAVKWPLDQIGQPVLSEKDAHLPLLSELDFGKHKER